MGPTDPIGEGMEFYLPYRRRRETYNFLTLDRRPRPNADAALARIKRIVWDIDPEHADPRGAVDARAGRRRHCAAALRASLSGAFTICAVLIAAVGVYGVSAYWVARRRRELAIRLAIGASPTAG